MGGREGVWGRDRERERERERESARVRARTWEIESVRKRFGSSFYMFFPPPGPALCKLGLAGTGVLFVLFVLPEVFTLVLGPSFDLPCLLATAILDSFSLFYLPNSSDSKEFACNAGNLGGEDLLGKEMATHSSTLARMSPWTEQLVNYSPWGHIESDRTQGLWFISLNFQISLKMTTYLLEICVCVEFTI